MSVKVDTNIYQVVVIIKSSTNYINKIPVNVSCSGGPESRRQALWMALKVCGEGGFRGGSKNEGQASVCESNLAKPTN